MIILRILGFSLLVTVPLQAAPPQPVAIVYVLTGKAFGAAHQPVRLFDRLPAGAALEVGPGSQLTLGFTNGLRYELSEGSRVTLGSKDFTARSGPVRSLPRVPPLPRLSAIAKEDRPGPKAGAVRIRSEIITGLQPDRGTVSLSSAVRLRFDPVPATAEYRVRIIGPAGETLFQKDTGSTEVSVSSDAISPGKTYHWTVETLGRPGAVARGEATLRILEADQARAREELQRWIQGSGVADDLKLLEGVDRALGLQVEPEAVEDVRCPLSEPGLVIETVAPESAAFRAGLMPGDRLFSWCRTAGGGGDCATRGNLHTPFDWLDLQMEDVQQGGVVVEGTRGAESLRWSLLPTLQGLTVAPLFLGELAEAYQSSLQAGDPAPAGEGLERTAEWADGNHCDYEALWLRTRAAQLQAKARQWPAVDAVYRKALAQAQPSRLEAHLRMGWSETLMLRGDLPQARQQLERALWLEEKHHPESLGVPTVLARLGNVIERQDDLEEADRLYRRSYDLAFRLAPGSGSEAAALNNLAVIAGRRGNLAQAESYAARAVEIREKLTPAGEAIIPSLLSYGNVVYARGDFARAETAFLRAKKILEKVQPESMPLAKTLHNLGELAYQRGDHDGAENLFRREIALFEKVDPSGNLMLDSLAGLGEVALRRHQVDKAEESWQRALAISERLGPEGPKTAWCLRGLSAAARLKGQPAEAEKLLRRALAIWQKINPEAVDAATLHLALGVLLLEQDDPKTAETHLRTAIQIQEKNHSPLPEGYHALARLQARNGRTKEAAATYLVAANALEAQRTRLGGAQESQWLYGSSLGDLYFEAAGNSIALARPQEAWKLIERGRAQGFQELLAQRDLRFPKEVPTDLYAERHRLAAEYDRAQKALADWEPEQGSEKLEALQGRLRDLRLEQAKVQERIQRSSPRLGSALANPTPIDLATVRSTLDPGTVLLTYAVGESRSFLFVIQAEGTPGPGLFFYPIPVGREGLAKEVEAFRNLLAQPDTLLPALKQRARDLYDLLVRPARPVIAKADRWVISPDGPLHSLPFAALVSGNHYLVESKPIHLIASVAVYKELKEKRPKPSTATVALLAVGDPRYPNGLEKQDETSGDPQVQTALRRGLRLGPLPDTRREVQAISSLFPGTQILLGPDATEEAIKSLAPQARRLHFACHGLLDERFPLNSALALSIPQKPEEGRDNGLLQAWEIFEELRLDADLVTLSACDSGLGKEIGGEGLVGLARAFHFAGARSVLASLWSVSDASTADLMKRFYGYLRAGKPKDEALRAAQVDQIRGKSGSSHPFYWAAFQITGDWR